MFRLATSDLILVIPSNYCTLSEISGDIGQVFVPNLYLTPPLKTSQSELRNAVSAQKTRLMHLSESGRV